MLIIFTEPHGYISTNNYNKAETVPTWNYMAVHIYGTVHILHKKESILEVMERTVIKYEHDYLEKWNQLSNDFKNRMLKGIVTFRVDITDIEGKAKLSQNKTEEEKENIISSLKGSGISTDSLLAEYMEHFNTTGDDLK